MNKSVDYYLSKGFDKVMAEYFAGGRKTIVKVIPNDDFTLTLFFDNGEKRIFDAKTVLQNTKFLLDKQNFNRVYLDSENCVSWDIDPNVDSNVVWNNKIDISPDVCYVIIIK